jgi:hypothetical protein
VSILWEGAYLSKGELQEELPRSCMRKVNKIDFVGQTLRDAQQSLQCEDLETVLSMSIIFWLLALRRIRRRK